MKASDKAAIVAAGRAQLREWLESAERHGTIYYAVPHVARSGMSRRIVLQTIVSKPADPRDPKRVSQVGRVTMSNLWPSVSDVGLVVGRDYSGAIDIVAKDWGFSFTHRAFIVGGCGMDMVFALVDDLAHKAGIGRAEKHGDGRDMYANRVKRESFG